MLQVIGCSMQLSDAQQLQDQEADMPSRQPQERLLARVNIN